MCIYILHIYIVLLLLHLRINLNKYHIAYDEYTLLHICTEISVRLFHSKKKYKKVKIQ